MSRDTVEDIEIEDADEGQAQADALALRQPDTPLTLDILSHRKSEALELINFREQILVTLGKMALRRLYPEDCVLFKAPDGRVVAYVADSGADRVRDIFGIEIYDVSKPERIAGDEPGVFHYVITGSGRCKVTGQVVEQMEGGRSSTDDFCKGKAGAELELLVRKSARANLDGAITRELSAMKSIPIDELTTAWAGTKKRIEHCRLGRGFGSKAERWGATPRHEGEAVEAPLCEICGATAKFLPAGKTKEGKVYEAFWSCPKRNAHPNDKWTMPDKAWRTTLQQQEAAKNGQARESGDEG
jgi:hypothetical protein